MSYTGKDSVMVYMYWITQVFLQFKNLESIFANKNKKNNT